MRIAGFLGLAALFATVAGDICQDCSTNSVFSANYKILGPLDAGFVAVSPNPNKDFFSAKRIEPATDEVWNRCKRKGCILEWSMHHSDNEVGPFFVPPRTSAQSPYQRWDDLATWYWHPYPEAWTQNEDEFQLHDEWGIGDALDELGVSSYTYMQEGGKNRILGVVHKVPQDSPVVDLQTYQVSGQTYRATGADFMLSLNTEEGVIIGLYRHGPAVTAEKRKPPVPAAQMPRLHQFSDVGWLIWQEMTRRDGRDAKNLRYLISVFIDNKETRSVCRRVFDNNNHEKLRPWPGLTLDAGTDDFHAILGTPNIQGYGYMLIQHKAQLGHMYISRIQVFQCTNKELCIVAHVSQPRPAPEQVPNEGVAEHISGRIRRDEHHNLVRTHKILAKL